MKSEIVKDKKIRVNSKNPVLCLFSGGIDSSVAAYLMMRLGFPTGFLYFDIEMWSKGDTKNIVFQLFHKLSQNLPKRSVSLYIVPHGENLRTIMESAPRPFTCILCRRLMYRIAAVFGGVKGYLSLVTGEIMGEHASQTLPNIASESSPEIHILRPLISLTKPEVEKIARSINIYRIASRSDVGCTAVPFQPKTRSYLEYVEKLEKNYDLERRIEDSLGKIQVFPSHS